MLPPFINRRLKALEVDTKDLLQSAIRSVGLRLFGLVVSYVLNLIIARAYGASGLGLYSLAATLTGIFVVLAQVGTQTSGVRFVAEVNAGGDFGQVQVLARRIVILVTIISVFVGAGLLTASELLGNRVFDDPNLSEALVITAFAVPSLAVMGAYTAIFRGLEWISLSYFFKEVFVPCGTLFLVAIAVLTNQHNILVPVAAYAGAAVLGGMAAFGAWRGARSSANKKAPDQPGRDYATPGVTEILATSMPMLASAAMLLVLGWTDVLMIGALSQTEDVGIYKVALRLGYVVSLPLVGVNALVAPRFSSYYWNGDQMSLQRLAVAAAKMIFWGSLPLFLIVIVSAPLLLKLFGPEFTAGTPALLIIATAQLVNALSGSVGYFLDMTGNQRVFRNIVGAGAILNVLLNALWIPPWGLVGAASATALSTVVWNVSAGLVIYHRFGMWLGYDPRR